MTSTALLVGLGHQMQENIFPAVRNDPDLKVLACYDIDPAVTRRFAERWRFTPVTADALDDAIAAHDVIVTAVPADQSLPYIEAGLRLGKKLFVEKPGAWSSTDLEALLSPYERAPANILVGYNFIFSTAVTALKRRIDELGATGALSCQLLFFSKHPGAEDPASFATFERWMRTNAVHPISIASFLFGEAVQVHFDRLQQSPAGFRMISRLEHGSGDITVMTLGNATPCFRLEGAVECAPNRQIRLRDLTEVIEDDHANGRSRTLYRRRPLSNGFRDSGYGEEIAALQGGLFPQARAVDLAAAARYLATAECLLEAARGARC